MNSRMQHFLGTTSVLLVLAVLLSGTVPVPFVTALEVRQNPPLQLVLQGSGDFPRLPVVAPGTDGTTLALYLVEGDTATHLMTLEGTRAGSNRADVQLSPDGQYVACMRTEGEYMRPVLEVVDTQEAQRVVIAEAPKDGREKGAAWEELVSVAWMDTEHILYSKVMWPSSEEWVASWEKGTPPPIQGEVWMSSVDGKEQRLLASGRIYRVLGASSEGKALYVTRLIPGREEWREEGFALLDLGSGEMKSLWPQEDRGADRYHSFKLIALPDGSRRLLFATAERGDTAATQPPVIWMGDPESGQAEAIWTIDQGKDWSMGEMTGAVYDIPRDFLWSPRSEQTFIYLADGAALGGVWRVDLEAEKAEPLGKAESVGRTGLRLLTWVPEGIVIQNQDVVWLLDENDEVRGEIHFREGEDRALSPLQVSSTVVDRDVPYVHQLYDTPAWFYGYWACGPTSMVMALAYYGQLSGDYGWHVPNEYTHQSACSGENTFDRMQYDSRGYPHEAWGAYGECTNDGEAIAWRMYEYAEKHDVGWWYQWAPSWTMVEAELRGGAVVILGTDLTEDGHIIVVRGYTNDSPTRYIVNDPAGDWHDGYYNDDGDDARYTWDEMSPNWYVALYGPEYLPYLYENSTWDDVLTIQNSYPDWSARAKVCFMNTNGSLNTTRENEFPANGIWSLPLSSVFGSFNGSAVVMRYQTSVSTIARLQRYDEVTIYNAIRGGGGSPGWQQVGSTLYAPVIKNNWYGRSSTIDVVNVGGASTNVSAYFYERNTGTYRGSVSVTNLSPNARHTFYASQCPWSSFCVVRFESSNGQSLAAVVRERASGDATPTMHNVFSTPSTTNYVPVVKNNYYGQSSGLSVYNTSGNQTYVTVTYYDSNSSNTYSSGAWLPAHATMSFYDPPGLPDGFLGSAIISASQPLVSAVHEAGSGRYKATNAFLAGGNELFVPELNTTTGYGSGISVQNVGSSATNVTVHYYNSNGTSAGTSGPYTVGAGKTRILSNYNGGIPSGLYGSARIESTNGVPLVSIVHYIGSGSGDINATYNGSQP